MVRFILQHFFCSFKWCINSEIKILTKSLAVQKDPLHSPLWEEIIQDFDPNGQNLFYKKLFYLKAHKNGDDWYLTKIKCLRNKILANFIEQLDWTTVLINWGNVNLPDLDSQRYLTLEIGMSTDSWFYNFFDLESGLWGHPVLRDPGPQATFPSVMSMTYLYIIDISFLRPLTI